MMAEDLVRMGSQDTRVHALALELVAHDSRDPLQALLDGLHRQVTYVPDCGDGSCEEVQRPDFTLFERRQGDCEDMSIAYASLARSLGYGARAVWLSQNGPNNHVPAQYCGPQQIRHGDNTAAAVTSAAVTPPANGLDCAAPNEWVWVETTLPGALVGEHPYAAVRRLGVGRHDIVR